MKTLGVVLLLLFFGLRCESSDKELLTYRNSEIGFSIQFPPDMELRERSESEYHILKRRGAYFPTGIGIRMEKSVGYDVTGMSEDKRLALTRAVTGSFEGVESIESGISEIGEENIPAFFLIFSSAPTNPSISKERNYHLYLIFSTRGSLFKKANMITISIFAVGVENFGDYESVIQNIRLI